MINGEQVEWKSSDTLLENISNDSVKVKLKQVKIKRIQNNCLISEIEFECSKFYAM